MSKPKHKPNHDNQHQHQGQAELQGQAQGQAQGQLQGQAQHAYQSTGQSTYQAALASNKNNNKNENENENKNENKVDNKLDNDVKNDVENKSSNKLDNKVDNDVDNKVENKVDNDIKNDIENHVENKVDVKVDLDLSASDFGSHDNDVIDIEQIYGITGSIVMPDAVSQTLTGNGNQFNLDQVNNLVDQDSSTATLSFSAGHNADWCCDSKDPTGATFSMWGRAEGGHAKVDDVDAKIGDDGNMSGIASATADGIVTQEAFTQNIVLGANIQFNQIDMTVAGNDLSMDDTL